MVYVKRVIIGHGVTISLRINEGVLTRARNYVASHQDQYDNLSHFIRAAMIKTMNEETIKVKNNESNHKK